MDLLEKEWFIQAPWGRISLVVWGDCWDPPVLLCHGMVDSAASFRPLVKQLPRKFYYIAMELPGNGKSDPFPPGLMISAYDIVYALRTVVLHFRWSNFIYMGHSLGTLLGKLYNLCYPGEMTKVVDFDPTPAYETVVPEEFAMWYHRFYSRYMKKYKNYNSPKEFAPKYPYEKALKMIKKNRGMSTELASSILERITENIGEGLVRFTFDQRFKLVNHPPFPPTQLQELYTNIPTPTLTIIAENSIKNGSYARVPFVMDEAAFPNKNYRYRRVEGNHDVHAINPDSVARFVTLFLLYGLEGLDEMTHRVQRQACHLFCLKWITGKKWIPRCLWPHCKYTGRENQMRTMADTNILVVSPLRMEDHSTATTSFGSWWNLWSVQTMDRPGPSV